jgi:hypothetical protein
VIIEWSSTYTVCLYFYLMGRDVDSFDLSYEQLTLTSE